MNRRFALKTALAAVLALPLAAQAAWPEKPVTIIVPAAPGGTTDIAARLLSDRMGKALGTSVVVENRAGAGGIVGAQQLTRAAPDGYTIMMGNIGPNAINYSMYKELPYKADDFKAITLVISVPNILVVNAESPAKSVQDLVALYKKDPSSITLGSSGTGQSPHLSGELFKLRTGMETPHVPYKGAGPAVSALLGNQFTFMIDNLPSSLPQIKGGKFRALAITSAERSPELPDVPTMAEAGVPDMVVTAWFGLVAPKGTPDDVIAKLHAAAKAALDAPETQARFAQMGGKAGGNTPAEFDAFINAQRELWASTVKAANISAGN
ncbi:MAG: tripartite tricarboxylate transporter substrate binding protein [Alcaligenaceae bacterium]|nr:tripartite tricarboxylate transporter substrate binding protein [Alcaligenaceae bacterium]